MNKRDFASGFIAISMGTDGATLTFDTGYGQTMPELPFYLTATPPGQLTTLGNSEKLLVTEKLSDEVFVVERAQGETIAKDIRKGWVVSNAVYVEDIAPVTSVNGEVGDVVITAESLGAELEGSAAAALEAANDYTDTAVGSLVIPNIADVAANTAARHTHANKAVLDATDTAYTAAQATKLGTIAAFATVNATDAALRARSSHTGTQPASTITGLAAVATSGSYNDLANKPVIPTVDYPVTSVNGRIGAVSGLAEDGNLQAHILNKNNPHEVDKTDVGLSNVSNLSPIDYPVSTAQQMALDAKVDKVTGKALSTNDYTTTEKTKLSGIEANAQVNPNPSTLPISSATQTALDAKANQSSTYTKTEVDDKDTAVATAAQENLDEHIEDDDPHPQYHNDDRGDARYAGQPYAVMAKAKFASLASSYGMLGKIFGNSGYLNDLQVYGESTQASVPTPDVPVPIVSTTGNVMLKSVGKNIINNTNQTNGFSGVSANYNGSQITVNGTATNTADLPGASPVLDQFIPSGTSLTFSLTQLSGSIVQNSAELVRIAVVGRRANGTANQISALSATAGSVTATAGFDFVSLYLRVTIYNTNVYTNVVMQAQLEVGATATAYAPHVGSTQTLPLGTTQLRSLPNGVSDRIYKSGSSWFLEQNINSKMFNGVETWAREGSLATVNRYISILPTSPSERAVNSSAVFASHFPGVPGYNLDTEHAFISVDGLALYLFANTSRAANAAAFRTWLSSNPTTVMYQLLVPVTTPITDPTLITALENIRTYQGITNITASTPVSGSYGLDLNTAFAGKVDTTGNQTIAGVKTFTSTPIAPSGTSIGGVLHLTGSGVPNGVVSAPVGSTYKNTNRNPATWTGDMEWVKQSGSGNTGWVVSVGDTGWRDVTSIFSNLELVNANDFGVFWKRKGDLAYVKARCQIKSLSTSAIPLPLEMRGIATNPLGPAPFRFNGQGNVLEVIDYIATGPGLYPIPSSAATVGTRGFMNGTYDLIASQQASWPSTLPGTAV